MRHYELMVILDPSLDERTVAPSLDTFLNVVRNDGGKVDDVEIWGDGSVVRDYFYVGDLAQALATLN